MALKISGGPLTLGGRGGLQIKSGGAAAFVPTSIASLKGWWKSTAGVLDTNDAVITVDATAVKTWQDQSGNANHFTQTNPVLRTIYKTAIVNGKPIIRGSGSTQYFNGPNFSAFTAGEIWVVVVAAADPPAADPPANGIWNFGTAASSSHYPYTDGVIYDAFGSTVRKTVGNPTPSLTAWRCYNAISTSSEFTANLDGTQLFTTATNTVGFPAITQLFGNSTTAKYFAGDIAEVLFFNAKLGTTDRASMKSYIASRYGLTIA